MPRLISMPVQIWPGVPNFFLEQQMTKDELEKALNTKLLGWGFGKDQVMLSTLDEKKLLYTSHVQFLKGRKK